jgi:hypothetical protein
MQRVGHVDGRIDDDGVVKPSGKNEAECGRHALPNIPAPVAKARRRMSPGHDSAGFVTTSFVAQRGLFGTTT